MHFEDFSYFSKHSIQINVRWRKNYARWTHFLNVKIGLLKRVNKWDFPRIYGCFLRLSICNYFYHN
jgi:hypothetical protein